MVKSMGELKKVVVSKVANNAAENRGNKRKYRCFLLLFYTYIIWTPQLLAAAAARVILF